MAVALVNALAVSDRKRADEALAVILCDGETVAVDKSWLQSESPRTGNRVNGLARLTRFH